MKVFTFDPADLRDTYVTKGWVHVRGGVSPEFLRHLQECSRHQEAQGALQGTGIGGAKDQHLYEPPDDVDLVGELRHVLTSMCGLRGEGFTLSERHLKAYTADADPDPYAHKDRLASQVSLGVSINVPAQSHLVLYPNVHREVNPFLTADFRESLGPDALPEVVLDGAPEVVIHDQPGDVIAFPGSSVWHLRRHCASTSLLYLKANDFDSDPLGEDPSTDARRQETIEILSRPDPAFVVGTRPSLSRRVEWIASVWGRDGVKRPAAKLWDCPLTYVSVSQFKMLDDIQEMSKSSSLQRSRTWGSEPREVEDLLGLARLGILDLLPVRTGLEAPA